MLVAIGASACLDRTRVNTRCEWPTEATRPLDLSDWPQQRHLYDDVAIAEELAIRYADAVHKERFGSEGHGGLIDGGRLRERCMTAMVSAIASTHHLTVDNVEGARARGYRDPRWDAGVLFSFVVLYGVLVWAVVQLIARRIPADAGWFALAAPALASIPAGLAAVQLLALWGAASEVVRIGNGHISSFRSTRNPWAGHGGIEWAAAVLIFLAVATIHHLRESKHRTFADA